MKPVYDRLTKEGKIGPFEPNAEGRLMPKPYAEYPKIIRLRLESGRVVKRAVKTHSEELAFRATTHGVAPAIGDSVTAERDALAESNAAYADENAALRAKIALMEGGGAGNGVAGAAAKPLSYAPPSMSPVPPAPVQSKPPAPSALPPPVPAISPITGGVVKPQVIPTPAPALASIFAQPPGTTQVK